MPVRTVVLRVDIERLLDGLAAAGSQAPIGEALLMAVLAPNCGGDALTILGAHGIECVTDAEQDAALQQRARD